MPDCPDCKVKTGMWENGVICPQCFTTWNALEARALPNFDRQEYVNMQILYMEFLSNDLIKQGPNLIRFEEDAIIIQHGLDLF